MQKEIPDFGMFLAEQALRRRFENKSHWEKIQDMTAFCKLEPHDSKLYQYYLRFQRYTLDIMIVDTYLRSLPEEKQKYIRYRYEFGKSNVWIAMRLIHVNDATLIKWNKDILLDIKDLLFYSLNSSDVYNVMTVINMVHILDIRINTFIDEEIPVNESWLRRLIQRRTQYKAMLNIMLQSLALAEHDTYHNIVASKLKNTHMNTTELAALCGVSCGTVSKHLASYRDSMKKFVSRN